MPFAVQLVHSLSRIGGCCLIGKRAGERKEHEGDGQLTGAAVRDQHLNGVAPFSLTKSIDPAGSRCGCERWREGMLEVGGMVPVGAELIAKLNE